MPTASLSILPDMILDGRAVADRRLSLLKDRIDGSRIIPGLATVIVGNDPASRTYVRMKHQACERVGIRSFGRDLPQESSDGEVIHEIRDLNENPDIHGILVQLPLPPHLNTRAIIESVVPSKDVDGFHPCNIGRLFQGNPGLSPCTPLGIIHLLEEYSIPLAGSRVAVLGRSVDVGRPLAAMCINRDATVTLCHRATKDLPSVTCRADIIVSAVGKAGFVTADMVKEGSVVVDVGINYVNNRLCGDVDFSAVREKAAWITPVPGGVGPMTIATLMENTFSAATTGR